jgi:hypothetical protein
MREVVATSDVRGKSYERQALTESPVMVDRELPVCCVATTRTCERVRGIPIGIHRWMRCTGPKDHPIDTSTDISDKQYIPDGQSDRTVLSPGYRPPQPQTNTSLLDHRMNRSSQTAGAHDWPPPQGSSALLPTPPLIPTPMPSLDLLVT